MPDFHPSLERALPRAPAHEHLTVDEETYWGLMYLHMAVKAALRRPDAKVEDLRLSCEEAERRLAQSREWNLVDPYHYLKFINALKENKGGEHRTEDSLRGSTESRAGGEQGIRNDREAGGLGGDDVDDQGQ